MATTHTYDDHNQPTREREVIVTDNSGGGGMSALVGVVAIIVLLVVGYFAVQAFSGSDGGADSIIPEDVNVNIDGGGGEG